MPIHLGKLHCHSRYSQTARPAQPRLHLSQTLLLAVVPLSSSLATVLVQLSPAAPADRAASAPPPLSERLPSTAAAESALQSTHRGCRVHSIQTAGRPTPTASQ